MDGATFAGATFSFEAEFGDWRGKANFLGATFAGDAYFAGATFSSPPALERDEIWQNRGIPESAGI